MKTTILVASVLVAALAPLAHAQTPAGKPPAPAAAAPSAPAASSVSLPSLQVAARVALVTGSVTIGTGEGARSLSAGDPVYERQTVYVGPNSYANLRFEDGGRVLLRPGTEFAIESYRFRPGAAAPPAPASATPGAATTVASAAVDSSAFFRLVRGGFRAISGLIGKTDHQAYRVTTPAATIGIRGTDYEVQTCDTDCPSQAKASAGGTEVAATVLKGLELAQAGGGGGGGVIVATHQGSISLHTSRGDYTVDAGKVALALANGQTFMLPIIPDVMLQNPAPSPEACE
jgi:hypothetical protein